MNTPLSILSLGLGKKPGGQADDRYFVMLHLVGSGAYPVKNTDARTKLEAKKKLRACYQFVRELKHSSAWSLTPGDLCGHLGRRMYLVGSHPPETRENDHRLCGMRIEELHREDTQDRLDGLRFEPYAETKERAAGKVRRKR